MSENKPKNVKQDWESVFVFFKNLLSRAIWNPVERAVTRVTFQEQKVSRYTSPSTGCSDQRCVCGCGSWSSPWTTRAVQPLYHTRCSLWTWRMLWNWL